MASLRVPPAEPPLPCARPRERSTSSPSTLHRSFSPPSAPTRPASPRTRPRSPTTPSKPSRASKRRRRLQVLAVARAPLPLPTSSPLPSIYPEGDLHLIQQDVAFIKKRLFPGAAISSTSPLGGSSLRVDAPEFVPDVGTVDLSDTYVDEVLPGRPSAGSFESVALDRYFCGLFDACREEGFVQALAEVLRTTDVDCACALAPAEVEPDAKRVKFMEPVVAASPGEPTKCDLEEALGEKESVGAPPQQPQQQQHMPLNPEAAPFEPAENETKEKEDPSAEGRELEKMRDMYERLADEAARTKERLSKLQDSLSRAGLEEFLDPEASEYAGPAGPDGNYVRCLKCRSVRHQDDMTFCYGCTAAIHTDCCKEEWKTYGPGQWCEACYDPDWDASSESSKSSESSDGRVDASTFQAVASQRDSLENELKGLRAERDHLKRALMVLRAELGGQGKKYTREEVDAVMEPLLQQAVQQAVDEMSRQMADQKKHYEACIERYERVLAVLNPH